MNRVEININPLVLRWAREEAGYEISEIADRLDVGSDRYKIWEKEGKSIPLGKLRKLADTYKRQLAVFLLPDVPSKNVKPYNLKQLLKKEIKLSRQVLTAICELAVLRELIAEYQKKNRMRSNKFDSMKMMREITDAIERKEKNPNFNTKKFDRIKKNGRIF